MNIFEYATRNKLRYPFKGMISTEDLWDLTPEDLDIIYKTLNKKKKQLDEDSLLVTKSSEDIETETKLAVIKHVFDTKAEEHRNRLLAKEKKEKKQKILQIMEDKQDKELHDKSIEELQRMLEGLE